MRRGNQMTTLTSVLLILLALPLFHSNGCSAHEPITRNRCDLKLVADYQFFNLIGNGDYAQSVRYLVNLVERINGIFTKVDWGLDINGNRLVNLGFSIKEIKILEEPNSTPMHYNSALPTGEDGSYSALDVLKSFSTEEGTNSTCMTVLISGKVFDSAILGLANIGYAGERGICATKPQNNTFMNTAVITVKRKSEMMITRVVDLVVAHELGHAWGSGHDDVNDPDCLPDDPQSGRYVMHESSNSGYDKSNYNFSPCSIRSIHKILYALASQCFIEEKAALCGNGILETGEECDSGKLMGKNISDHCCTNQCKLRPNAVCPPVNTTEVKKKTDSTLPPRQKFFADYSVFIIVFVSLLFWCPIGALIVWKDHQHHIEAIQRDDVLVIQPRRRAQ